MRKSKGQLLQALIEKSSYILLITDPEGTVRHVSPAVEPILGYKPAEIIGSKIVDNVHPDDLSECLKILADDLERPTDITYTGRYRYRHKKGTWRMLEYTYQLVTYNSEVTEAVVLCHDVTEQELAQKALRESEARLRSLIDDIPDTVFVYDLKGTFLDGNKKSEELTGYPRHELIGKNFAESGLFSEKDILRLLAALLKERNGELAGTEEYELFKKDGSRVLVETTSFPAHSGNNVEMIGIARDITEQRRTEETLRESEAKYRNLLEQVSDGIIIALNNPLRIVFANRAIAEMLWYAAEDLISLTPESCIALVHPDDQSNFMQRFTDQFRGKVLTPSYEFHGIRKDGTILELSMSASLTQYNGQPALLGILTDMSEIKQSEEAIRKSEQLFQAIVENSFEGVRVIAPDGIVSYDGPSVTRILGYERDEQIGKNVFDYIHPDDRERLFKTMAQDLISPPGHPRTVEYRYRHKDGSWCLLESTGQILLDGSQIHGVALSYRDITERKQAEEVLRKNEQLFRAIVENSSEGIEIVDLDGTIRYDSPSIKPMMGYEPSERIGQNTLDGLHPDDRERLTKALMESINSPTARPRQVEYRYKHNIDGTWHVMEGTGQFMMEDSRAASIVLNYHDITERKRAEEMLRKNEQLFRTIVENSSDAIGIIDPTGIVRYDSPSIKQVTGYEPSELIGASAFDLIHPDDMPKLLEDLSSDMQTPPHRPRTVEFRHRHKDGSWRIFQTTGQVLSDGSEVTGIVINTRDVTEYRRAESALRESEAKYRTLVEQLQDGIVIAQENPLRLVFANPAMANMLGYTMEELQSLTPEQLSLLVHPEDQVVFFQRLSQRFTGQSSPGHPQYRLISKDGTVVWVGVSAAPIQFEGKRAALAVLRDISEDKRAEEQLGDAEALCYGLVERANDGIAILNQQGKMIYVNKAHADTCGYSVEEMLGTSLMQTVAPECFEDAIQRFQRRVDGGGISGAYELKILRKDGVIRDVEVSAGRTTYRGEQVISAIIRDTTERKRAERALRESEERYAHLFKNVPIGIYRNTPGPEGKFLLANPAIARMFGYNSVEDFLQTSVANLYERPDERIAFSKELASSGEVKAYELCLKTKDGQRIWGAVTAKAITDEAENALYFDGMIEDITERKRVEEALLESEKRYRAIFENPLNMMYINDATGHILDANDWAIQRLGYSRENLGTISFKELVHPDDYERAMIAQLETITQGHLAQPVEVRLITKSGESIWVETCGYPIKQEGSYYRGLGIAKDISERKQAEEALRRAHDELEQRVAERTAELNKSLQQKDVLLKELHHRVKNNLQVVSSLLSLQSKHVNDASVRQMLKETQDRVMSMALLHQELYLSKDLAKIDFGKYFQDVASQLLASYGATSGRIKIKADVEEAAAGIDIAIPCGLIVSELVSNCLKHAFSTGEPGEISIGLHSGPKEKLTLTVSDNGTGFPEDLDFKKTRSLGLQLVNALTRQIEGSISLDRNGGTTFAITFPKPKRNTKRRRDENS